MRLRDTGRWLLRCWPMVGGALLLAALAAGLYLGFSDSEDIVAQPEPTPDVVFNTPTQEEWRQAFIEVTPIHIIPTPKPAAARQTRPLSKAHAEFLAAPGRRAIYFEELDRVVHLPKSVGWVGMWVHECHRSSGCPSRPTFMLATEHNRSNARLGPDGYLVTSGDPEAFEFLSEAGFKRFE